MESTWLLHERGRIGEEGTVLDLSRKSLRIGRSSDCDVVLENQTVEQHHAQLEWNQRTTSFSIRDLGTVNGTYVNNMPLRGTSVDLSHNDSFRFGYDKERVFRMEEVFSSSRSHSAKKTPSSSAARSPAVMTTPPHPAVDALPVRTVAVPTGVTGPPVGVVNGMSMVYNSVSPLHQQYQSVAVPLANQGYIYTTTPPLAPGVNILSSGISGGGSTGQIPFSHSPIPPEIHSQSTPAVLSSSSSSCPSHISQQQHQQPLLPQGHVHQAPTSHHSSSLSSSSAPSIDTPSVHRSDGRRAVNLDQSPGLNKGSKLYGEPSWWGDENKMEENPHSFRREYELSRPGSQILRDIDGEKVRKDKDALASKLSARGELRLQTISSSSSPHPQQDSAMPNSPPGSSWTVDFGGGGGGNTLPRRVRSRERLSRPRSADPSPVRGQGRRDPSPLPGRPITPGSSSSSSSSSVVGGVRRRSSLNSGRNKPSTSSSSTAKLSPSHRGRAATPPAIALSASPSLKPHPPMSSVARSQRSSTPPVRPPASPTRKRATTMASSYRNPIVPSVQKLAAKPKNVAAGKDSTSGSRSPTHHPPLPNKLSPKRMASQASSRTTPTTSSALGVPRNASPSHEDNKSGSEAGESTYVVATADDSSSLSSLSDPSFNSASDSIVVVTPESAAKQQQKKEKDAEQVGTRPKGAVVGGGLPGAASADADRKGSGEGGVGVAAGDEGRKESRGSSRKQWVEDDSQPCMDTLMMASIEARMRRLSQLAHQTARQATTLKSRVQEGRPMEVGGVDYLSIRGSSPVMTKIEQSLPEWRSFNKEANSIFRNIRIVEKWLQDIDANLKCIRPVEENGNKAAADAVDYFSNDSNEEEPAESANTA